MEYAFWLYLYAVAGFLERYWPFLLVGAVGIWGVYALGRRRGSLTK